MLALISVIAVMASLTTTSLADSMIIERCGNTQCADWYSAYGAYNIVATGGCHGYPARRA